jgi:benzylsuccinate CoA-transferase BbsF subunit
MPQRILEGVKVADFTWALAGPITTKILAIYGAQVVKIEGRTRPDVERASVPPYKDDVPGVNRAGFFNHINNNKLSVAINLAKPKGVEVAKRLVAWADIVVDNFAGGVMKRLGLSYDELKRVKPDIIMLSSSMQGQTGPHSQHPGFGQHLTPLSGFNHITGWPDREPPTLVWYTDYIAPHFSILALVAALLYRRRTGRGQYFDMSQYENGVHFLSPLILDYVVNKRVSTRMGNRSAYAIPHGAYRCRGDDRWCVIAVSSDEEWERFCKVTGKSQWRSDPRFMTFQGRKENEDELDRLVESWTVNRSAEQVMTEMQGAGVSAGVVQTGEDLIENDPHLKSRHFYWELEHPEIGMYRAPGPAFRLSKLPCELESAPLLGEHNEYVLKEILGMSDEEIAELIIEGAIE